MTAFELWLFDKNDIRTITQIIASEYAYHDLDIRMKLTPRGDIYMALPAQVIELQTSKLRVHIQVNEVEYGEHETLPPRSFFKSFTVAFYVSFTT